MTDTQTIGPDELLTAVRGLRRYELLTIAELEAPSREAFDVYMMAATMVWFARHGYTDEYRELVDQAAHYKVWGTK